MDVIVVLLGLNCIGFVRHKMYSLFCAC